jgi:hypothetical protein
MPPLFVLLQSCQMLTFENRLEYPLLAVNPNPQVEDFTATLTTDFLQLGNQPYVSYGICWNRTGQPDLDDSTVVFTGRPPIPYFTTSLPGLTPQTRYYARSFATAGKRTVFSAELAFTTLPQQRPEVVTGEILQEGAETLTLRGRIGQSGSSPVVEHGYCWNTSPAPTVGNARTQLGAAAPGDFTSVLSGIRANTRYYIRAYATNQQGTAYGAELSLTKTCQAGPTMGASGVSAIADTSALATGNIANRGCSDITAYGHCWDTRPNPDLARTHTQYAAGTVGNFNSPLSGLLPNTLYYIRSYATNAQGTTFGNQLTFTTRPRP